jgi:hypothetical protein
MGAVIRGWLRYIEVLWERRGIPALAFVCAGVLALNAIVLLGKAL